MKYRIVCLVWIVAEYSRFSYRLSQTQTGCLQATSEPAAPLSARKLLHHLITYPQHVHKFMHAKMAVMVVVHSYLHHEDGCCMHGFLYEHIPFLKYM